MNHPSPYTLYLVTERSMIPEGITLTECVLEAVRGGVTMVQLREKEAETSEFLQLARELNAALAPFNIPLIINDRVDIALECGAHGVHLGQSDMAPEEARRILGKPSIIGLSVESEEQFLEALHAPVDYLALSPVFSTPTKTDTVIEWGLDGLRMAASKTDLPVIAIGGMNVTTVEDVVRSGASGIAVVSAICASKKPFDAAKKLRTVIDSAGETLASLGEFGLIEQIRQQFQSHQPDKKTLGIGDDSAILPLNDQDFQVVTADLLVEHQHFKTEWTSAADLAYKALAVNISDICAMGARPEYAFLSLGIPKNTPLSWIRDFFSETHSLCRQFGVGLMGGDTTASGLMVLNYTLLGRVKKTHVLRRDGARPGDCVMLLGLPGLSGAGLRLLLENNFAASDSASSTASNEASDECIQQHHRPRIFPKEAVWLAETRALTSMIDLSDGLASDARHLSTRSQVNIEIHLDQIPLPEALKRVCTTHRWDPWPLVLASGEDYGLLFTVKAKEAETLIRRFSVRFDAPLSVIGDVRKLDNPKEPPSVTFMKHGTPYLLPKRGFDHFLEA